MTVAKAAGFQTDVFAAVQAAVSGYGLGVFDHPPQKRPDEFLRLDGFSVTDVGSKSGEIGRHSFEVHHFLANVGGQASRRGQLRSKQVLGGIHAALMAGSFQGGSLRFEYMEIGPDLAEATAMHGVLRYTITLV